MPTASRHPTRDDRFAVLIMNVLAVLVLLVWITATAAAMERPAMRPDQAGEGALLLRPMGEESYRAALVQKTDVPHLESILS